MSSRQCLPASIIDLIEASLMTPEEEEEDEVVFEYESGISNLVGKSWRSLSLAMSARGPKITTGRVKFTSV